MSEEVSILTNKKIPVGYVVSHHERRGYDSPDRWYQASTQRKRQIGEFGTFLEALNACRADAQTRRRSADDR